MKKIAKLLGVLALALLIGFSMAGCNGESPDNSNNPFELQPFDDITAAELVANIKIGWNLGNTFDAYNLNWLGNNPTVAQLERGWVNHTTTQSNINTIKAGGFNTIRIPVSWHKVCDTNFNIRTDWMARITEVVNYAVTNDMYIILNTHHDEDIFKFRDVDMPNSLKAFNKIWEQIAENFMNYNEKLIFEGLNEPRTKGTPAEWNGGTEEERNNLNIYYQNFVDTVRATGGNNDKRFLMINTYGASAGANAVNGLVLPNDTAENKLIVSVHFYEPYNFALNTNASFNTWSQSNSQDTGAIIERVNRVNTAFVSKGIPVIIGEFGAMNKNNEDIRAVWAEFYVKTAKDKGIPCIWWDNGGTTGSGELFGLLNRSNNTFHYPKVLDGLMRGAGVTN